MTETAWTYRTDCVASLGVAYRVSGIGRPVVLLHGFGTTSASWAPCHAELPQDCGYYFIDLPGHGRSTRDLPPEGATQYCVDATTAFLNRFGTDGHVLVGHSFGGLVALLALASGRVTARTSALVLIDVPAFLRFPPKIVRFFRSRFWSSLLVSVLPARLLVYLAQREVFANPSRIPRILIDEYSASLRVPGTTEALQRLAHELGQWAQSPPVLVLDAIRVRTLIVWGSDDRLVPIQEGRALHAAIRGSQLSVISKTGHAPQEESPRELAANLSRFLSEVQ